MATEIIFFLTHFILETLKEILGKSADADQMPHNVSTILQVQQKYLNAHDLTPLKLKMDSSHTYGRRVQGVVGWCDFQCRGVLLTWIRVGLTALAVGAAGVCLDFFSLVYNFSFLSPSLWKTSRFGLK